MQLTIPTIFTAVDKMTAIFSKMGSGISTFAEKAEKAAARGNRAFNKFTPTLSETSHKFIELGEEAISAAAIFEGLKFSGEALAEWDTALASLRTKLSNLSDKDFAKFQEKINQVAFDAKESSVEVAAGFEKIATLNKKFAESADSLGEVSKASILLSKIQKTDVATSADGLVGIMNLYSLSAEEADKTVNVLATSQSKFASSITDTMAGLTAFGPLAKHYNVSLEQSTALLDVLAEKQIKGEEAGSALRMTIIKLQAAHAGYKSGVFNLSDALDQVKGRLDKFRTAKEKDNFISGLFGRRQQATGILLLENIDKIKAYTKGVAGSTEAERIAEISENNLGSRLAQLKNRWIDLLTSQSKTNAGLNILKKTLVFVTDHLGTIVTIGASILVFFLAWKLLLVTTSIILGAYNIALGVMGALTGVASVKIGESTVALGAYRVTTVLATASTWLFNGALTALSSFNAASLVGKFGMLGKAFAWVFVAVHAIGLLTDSWESIKKSFANFDIWVGISKILRALIVDLMDFISPLNKLIGMIGKLTGIQALSNIATDLYRPITDKQKQQYIDTNNWDFVTPKPPLSPPPPSQLNPSTTQGLNHNLSIDLNDPFGVVKNTKMSGPFGIPVKVTKTQGQK